MTLAVHAQRSIPSAEERPVSLARKRELGAFYTPPSVTKILCDWAIRTPSDVLLEPSFGGCNFLEASVRRVQELGSDTTETIYGCDIDPAAFEMLNDRKLKLHAENFKLKNFLLIDSNELSTEKADAVIGNPPYVRYSKLDEAQRAAIHIWEQKYNLKLNRRASLWTYFSYHALHFLKSGGRIAWVLPVSFMTAQYAAGLRELFFKSFKKLAFFTLTERIFLLEGTEERALIVLGDGFGCNSQDAHITSSYVDNLSELYIEIEKWTVSSNEDYPSNSKSNFGIVSAIVESSISRLKLDPLVKELGELSDVGIGVVTGNAKFFIRPHAHWRADGIGNSHLTYILPKSRFVTGLEVSTSDRERHKEMDVPCFALDAPSNTKSEPVLEYLSGYGDSNIKANATFAKRSCWFRFLDGRIPDAFFVFMTHNGPRVILNSVHANTTNGFYRVNFKPDINISFKLIAISLQTTFTQLEAEKLGRPRGSGALKLEPCDAKLLPLYLPHKTEVEIEHVFSIIDRHMREGNEEYARTAADQFIFSGSSVFRKEIPHLTQSLMIARKRRIRNKEVSDD